VVIIILSLVSGFFSFLMRQTVVVASRHIEFDLRNRLYSHLQHLSQGFYHRRATGDIITRATRRLGMDHSCMAADLRPHFYCSKCRAAGPPWRTTGGPARAAG
jgi:hypothetical protein